MRDGEIYQPAPVKSLFTGGPVEALHAAELIDWQNLTIIGCRRDGTPFTVYGPADASKLRRVARVDAPPD